MKNFKKAALLTALVLVLAALLAACDVAPTPTPTPTNTPMPTATATPTATPTDTPVPVYPSGQLDAALEQLKTALEHNNQAKLRGLLGRPFLFGFYRSEGLQSEDSALVMELLTSYGLGNSTVFVDLSVDARKLLEKSGGAPAGVEHVAYSTGWGTDGDWSAFLYLASQQGQMRWTGIVLVSPEAKDF